jgi:acyl dehydratase
MTRSAAAATREPGSIEVGDTLLDYTVTLTLQRLVMEAGANRDFAPIHFDLAAARESGAPNVYANTTLIETLFEALIRTWSGPDARIRVIEFSMTAFNCVGDDISARGVVKATDPDAHGRKVELDLWIEGPRGRTVSGSAVVVFPGG